MDAHLGERIVDTNTRIDDLGTCPGERISDTSKRIDHLAVHLGERIDDTNTRLDKVDKRFEQVDKRFDELVSHLRAFEQRLFDQVLSVQTELGRRIGRRAATPTTRPRPGGRSRGDFRDRRDLRTPTVCDVPD